jgi:general secretion pathway protein M
MTLDTWLMRHPAASRGLALGLLLGLLALAAWLVSIPLRAKHAEYDNAIADRIKRIEVLGRIASTRPALEAAIAGVKKQDTARYYLKNSSPALAAAELQEIAQGIIDANAMKSGSIQIAPHQDELGRRRIMVKLQLRGTPEAMQKTLYGLETRVPYLFIDNLSVRATVNSRRWAPTPMVEPEVQVAFDLSAYAQIPVRK